MLYCFVDISPIRLILAHTILIYAHHKVTCTLPWPTFLPYICRCVGCTQIKVTIFPKQLLRLLCLWIMTNNSRHKYGPYCRLFAKKPPITRVCSWKGVTDCIFVGVYVLVTSKVISGQILICDSADSWWIYSGRPWPNIPHSHIVLTLRPVLVLS